MSKEVIRLYDAKIVWHEVPEGWSGEEDVIIASPNRYYEAGELPDDLDDGIFFYQDIGEIPKIGQDLGDCVVVWVSDEYEDVEFETEDVTYE